ncbi:MAG: DUF4215 domain-containing protein [Minicystis sp.]
MNGSQLSMGCIGVCAMVLLGPACGGGGSGAGGSGAGTSTTSDTTTTTDTTSTSVTTGAGGDPTGTGGSGVGGGTGGSATGGGGAGGAIPVTCGDGKIDVGEECDDGDKNANISACTLACKKALCGDGFVQSGVEECDQGAQNSNAGACTLACKVAVCGDGLKAPSEGCDDGNMIEADGCNPNCVVSGAPLWSQTYAGAGNGIDVWNAVTADSAGNVIATGRETVGGQGANVITRKYDGSGNVLWTQTYAGVVAGGDDEGNGVAADAAGNVVVIGYESTAAQGKNIWLRKYGPNGAVLWTQSVNGSPLINFDDIGYGVAAGPGGDFYIAASAQTTAGQGRDTIVGKISGADGNFIWFDTYNGVVSQDDEARTVAFDGAGNIVTAGVTRGPTSFDVWVRKIADLGGSKSITWTSTYNGLADGLDVGFAIDVDAQGNPVVVGAETVTGQGLNMWICKFSSAQGNPLWTQGYDGPAHKNDIAEGVIIDAVGNVIVAGFDSQADLSTNVRIRKYTAAGTLLWTQFYNGAANDNDAANGVTVDASGSIFIAGFENVNGQNANALLRKHAP